MRSTVPMKTAKTGIVNLVTAVTTVKIIKHQNPDVLESEWREL